MPTPGAELLPKLKEAEFSGAWIRVGESWSVRDRAGFDGIAGHYAAAFRLPAGPREHHLTLTTDSSLGEEAYRLSIAEGEVEVRAASRRGFRHALSTLSQLRDGPLLPAGTVYDYPRLPLRGIHLMYESFRRLGEAETLALLTSAARLKLNAVLLEFGDRFPFHNHPVVSAPSALTVDQVSRIVAHARDLGMEITPLQQSLGHLRYLLKHDKYAALREEEEHQDQMCPLNEGSLRMFTELAEEVLALMGECRLFHIGADETRRLGVCPRCRPYAEAHGKGSLYLQHINKVCAWLSARGLTPVLWDDILCAHPELMDGLHESAWVMYWDYWTTQHPSPHIVARYNPEQRPGVIVHDRRWEDEWKAELPDVTAHTLSFFSHPTVMEERLGGDFQRVFGSYLGDQFPKYLTAFPYLEFYQDRGRRVIGAPTCSGNTSDWLGLPDFPRYGHNIHTIAARCIEARAEGLVTTAWYNRVPEVITCGLLPTAEFTW
jgi:hypothetical protein